jgi:hypothetical protein
LRLGVAKCVASENKIRGRNGNSGDAKFFQSSGKETGTESFAKGGETIEELGSGLDRAFLRYFVEEIAGEELEGAANVVLPVLINLKILKNIQVEMNDGLGFVPSARELALVE